jgi:SAM-dependent methyltransferase
MPPDRKEAAQRSLTRTVNFMNFSRRWKRLNEKTIGTDAYWTIAVQNQSIFRDTKPFVSEFIRGRTIDVGAGRLAWKRLLSHHAASCVSSDFMITHDQIDLVFDVTNKFPLKDSSFDSLFCHSVLEHTTAPWAVFDEFSRILKPDGILLLSVPFLFYLHGAPFDFFRFTKFGVIRLAEGAGFAVEKIKCSGGIFHFLFNMPSVVLSVLLSTCGLSVCIPPITRMLGSCARFLDRLFDPRGLFALNIVCVLRKQ